MSSNHTERATCYEFQPEDDEPYLLNQSDLNDLVCDLNVSKLKAEIYTPDCNNGIFYMQLPRFQYVGKYMLNSFRFF